MSKRRWFGLAIVLALAGCALQPPSAPPGEQWQGVTLPGKEPTRYEWSHKDGRPALWARSDRSASMWRRQVAVPADALGELSFSWWVPAALPQASVAVASREDAPARVMLAFAGDESKLPWRTRARQ